MEANSNTVVSSLEMILLAVDNIYEKCARKSAWTQHGDLKEFEKYDKNDTDKKKLYQKRVQEAKTKIKYINSYIKDYQTITEEYKRLRNALWAMYENNLIDKEKLQSEAKKLNKAYEAFTQ